MSLNTLNLIAFVVYAFTQFRFDRIRRETDDVLDACVAQHKAGKMLSPEQLNLKKKSMEKFENAFVNVTRWFGVWIIVVIANMADMFWSR